MPTNNSFVHLCSKYRALISIGGDTVIQIPKDNLPP